MKKTKSPESKKKDQLTGVAEASKPNAKKAKNKLKKVVAAAAKEALVKENGAASPGKKNVDKNQKKSPKKDEQETEVKVTENSKTEHKEGAEELGVSDLAKIEKKKSKKLAQKLKKQQNKKEGGNKADKNEAKKDKSVNKTEKKDKKKQQKEKKAKGAKPEGKQNPTVVAPKDPKLIEKKKLRAEKKLKQKEERKQNEGGDLSRDPVITAATVFVGNLPVNTKRVQLVKLFDDYAPVNAVRFRTAGGKVIFKHKHRTEAGTLNAYVVLKDAETAARALALNGTEFKEHQLRVTRADMNSQNRGEGDAKRMIFVGNLKYSANEEKLREIFSSCGEVEYVRCLRDGEKGCKGVSYVCFKSPEAVGLAMELNETMLDERPIHVERYSVKKLGAKQVRDASAEADKKKSPKTGAKKRLDDKNKNQKKGGNTSSKENGDDGGDERKKKGEYRGVKVGGITKKPNKKKKKTTSQMQQLAKKIAPKAV